MKRTLSAFLCIIILFLSPIFSAATAGAAASDETQWPGGPGVYADSAIVMEASTGLILYEKNMDDKNYPASITKIMTALLAIENSSLGEIVTFSKNAVFDVDLESSRIGIDVGEQLTMQQCLYGILLASANEVSYAVAEHIAGSVDAFVDMMNKKAKELGCTNTHFTNPHGLPDNDHYTTSHDMALITQAAMKNETFRKIFGTRTYQIPPTNIQPEARPLSNHHKFVLQDGHEYDDAIGGKTGYTSAAKYTLVTVAKRGDLELICVIMREDTSKNQYGDTKKLLDYAFDNFSIYTVADLESTQVLSESPMFTRYNPLLSKASSPLEIDKKGFLILPNSASFEDAAREVEFFSPGQDQAAAETSAVSTAVQNIVGEISYSYGGKYVGGANILYKADDTLRLAQNENPKNNPTTGPKETISEKAEKSSLRPIILGSIIGLFVLILLLYFILVERPRLKRRSAYYKKRARRKLYRDDDYLNL